MTARVLCLACRVLALDRSLDAWTRYNWMCRCMCGALDPAQYQAACVEMAWLEKTYAEITQGQP